MFYKLLTYCLSDVGLIRQNNEDACQLLQDERFFVLADGMGGHQAGEVASKETVEILCTLFQSYTNCSLLNYEETQQLLRELIQEVNKYIYGMGRENSELRGMGTTLCCILFHPEGLIYGHVGDSRIYRFRHHRLERLTQDHSLLRELIDLGQLSEQQAGEFQYKNIITKAIGTEPIVEPTIQCTPIEVGDMILMCTDGLTDLVHEDEIQKILNRFSEEEVVQQLIKKANQNGGYDNITVILVKVQDKYDSSNLFRL